MLWASLGILALIVICAFMIMFLILQGVSQTLANSLATLERVHTSDGKRIDTVLDRLMAMDFESFKNYQLAENADEGGIEEFEEPYVRLEAPGIGPQGLGGGDLMRTEEERRIMMEDFPVEEEVEA